MHWVRRGLNFTRLCGGLLLQSPLLSGAYAVFGEGTATAGACLDIFKNYATIPRVRCRVCVMHGTADKVVPCWNGRRLLARAADPHEPLWCEGHGHNDMPEERCLAHASRFLDYLVERDAAFSHGAPTPETAAAQ